MTGMSDWDLAELEDIDWNDFGNNDDHIVPHQGSELVDESLALSDAHKKPRHEVKNDAGWNMCCRGSATKTILWGKENAGFPLMKDGSSSILERSWSHASNIVVPALGHPERSVNIANLPSQDVRIYDSSLNDPNTQTNCNMFCSKDHSLGTRVSTNDTKSCLSSLNGVSPDVTDLSFLESEQNDRENDLVDDDWPDIGNFEDIDKMFRNWNSTFGRGQTGTADELSWFSSSSQTIYGLEIAFESGLQSSSSELSVLHAKLEHDCANTNFLPNNVPTSTDHDKPSYSNYADCMDTDSQNKAKSASKEKLCDGGNKARNIGLTKISNEYSFDGSGNIMMESQHSSEAKQFSQQKHFIGSSSSSYMHSLNPHAQLELDLPTHQVPFTQTTSSIEFENENESSSSYNVSDHVLNHPIQCMERLPDQLYVPQIMATEENIEKLHQRQQLCATMTAEHPQQQQPAFRSKASGQKKQLETRSHIEMEDIGLELPLAQESSGVMSVFSDDMSEKATCLQQLQDVMHQLDIRTKLCIRESMYRLARSAKQRHSVGKHNCSGGYTDSEVSKKSADLMDAEKNTNPIDRTIASLLFHKPSEPATRSADDTTFESRVMLHVPTNQILVLDQFDHQRIFGGCSDMETDHLP